jgi:putative oxidoreductase
MAAIFLPSGFGKLTHLAGFEHMLAAKGLPAPGLLAVIGAASEFSGSVLIALGLFTRWAALLMAVFTVIAALISHDFWIAAEAARRLQYLQFMKNMAIVGGFLILLVGGPGRVSIDRALR